MKKHEKQRKYLKIMKHLNKTIQNNRKQRLYHFSSAQLLFSASEGSVALPPSPSPSSTCHSSSYVHSACIKPGSLECQLKGYLDKLSKSKCFKTV